MHTAVAPSQVLLAGEEVLAISETNATRVARIYVNSRQCWYYDAAEKDGTVKIKLAKRCVKSACDVTINSAVAKKVASQAYPKAPKEIAKRIAAAKEQTKYVAGMNSPNLYQQMGQEFKVPVDGSWKRVTGSVVCSSDTDPKAVVTFRLTTDTGKVIFERVGQKGNDAPQLVAVNIPSDANMLIFSVKREDDGVPSLGVWKDIKLVK